MKYLESYAYEVRLYIGSREGYHGDKFSEEVLVNEIRKFQKETKRERLVSLRISQCLFVVGDWDETGWEVAAINYPRFPKTSTDLDGFMIELAKHLLVKLKQNRITVVMPGRYLTIESDTAEEGRKNDTTSLGAGFSS